MKCPMCGIKAAYKETRQTEDGPLRRYHCACGVKFKTLEVLDVIYTAEGLRAIRSENMKKLRAKQRKTA